MTFLPSKNPFNVICIRSYLHNWRLWLRKSVEHLLLIANNCEGGKQTTFVYWKPTKYFIYKHHSGLVLMLLLLWVDKLFFVCYLPFDHSLGKECHIQHNIVVILDASAVRGVRLKKRLSFETFFVWLKILYYSTFKLNLLTNHITLF